MHHEACRAALAGAVSAITADAMPGQATTAIAARTQHTNDTNSSGNASANEAGTNMVATQLASWNVVNQSRVSERAIFGAFSLNLFPSACRAPHAHTSARHFASTEVTTSLTSDAVPPCGNEHQRNCLAGTCRANLYAFMLCTLKFISSHWRAQWHKNQRVITMASSVDTRRMHALVLADDSSDKSGRGGSAIGAVLAKELPVRGRKGSALLVAFDGAQWTESALQSAFAKAGDVTDVEPRAVRFEYLGGKVSVQCAVVRFRGAGAARRALRISAAPDAATLKAFVTASRAAGKAEGRKVDEAGAGAGEAGSAGAKPAGLMGAPNSRSPCALPRMHRAAVSHPAPALRHQAGFKLTQRLRRPTRALCSQRWMH